MYDHGEYDGDEEPAGGVESRTTVDDQIPVGVVAAACYDADGVYLGPAVAGSVDLERASSCQPAIESSKSAVPFSNDCTKVARPASAQQSTVWSDLVANCSAFDFATATSNRPSSATAN